MNQNPKRVLKPVSRRELRIAAASFNESKPEEGTETRRSSGVSKSISAFNESKPEEGTETKIETVR